MYRIIMGLWLISNLSLANDVFDYVIKNYPKQTNCAAAVEPLAARFHELTGLDIYWSGAVAEDKTTCDIKISYVASQPVDIETNVDRYATLAPRGTHATYAECVADLPREAEIFKNSTQIEPWLSYCYFDHAYSYERPWVASVNGLGKGVLSHFAAHTMIAVTPVEGWNVLVGQVSKLSYESKIPVASIITRPDIGGRDMTMHFYAKERLYLANEKAAHYRAPLVCENQVDEIRAALLKAKTPPVAVYCGKYFDSEKYLGVLTLSTKIGEMADIVAKEDPKAFTTFEACREAIPATLEFYGKKLQKNALAGMCADGSGAYRITVFSEKIVQKP